jgi:hypothetical protein
MGLPAFFCVFVVFVRFSTDVAFGVELVLIDGRATTGPPIRTATMRAAALVRNMVSSFLLLSAVCDHAVAVQWIYAVRPERRLKCPRDWRSST